MEARARALTEQVALRTENVQRIAFYLAAVGFHWAFFFTSSGNYFHGGTPVEWVGMQGVAVLIVFGPARLLPKVRMAEKLLVTLCAAAPAVSLAWALFFAWKP